MTIIRKPKAPRNLKEKTVSQALREKLEIPAYTLASNYDTWSLRQLINDYLLINQNSPITGHNIYDDTIKSMEKIIESNECQKGELSFIKKFLKYMNQATGKREFLLVYQTAERKKRLDNSRVERGEEVQIASNELVEENLREERERRRVCFKTVIYQTNHYQPIMSIIGFWN
jgi:hypothetical protein